MSDISPASLLSLYPEDAPAPSGLHSFKTHVENGKIFVTANVSNTLKENKDRPPKLLSTGFDSIGKGVVIVGGGSGAFYAVESLREVGLSGRTAVRK